MSFQKSKFIQWFILRPVKSGLIVSITLLLLGAILSYQRYLLWQNQEERNAYSIVESVKTRLQRSLAYSQAATLSMALSLQEGNIPGNIDSIAAELLRENKYIDALQLVPGGTIRYVYPIQGNEAVIGYNILADPTRNKEAYKAIEQRKLYFAGPLRLKQGGVGVVGRLPVFTAKGFWGFSAVIIRFHTLLEAAGIDTTGASGYYYQFSKINPDSGTEEFFLPVRKYGNRQFNATVQVADGEWKLSVFPVKQDQTLLQVLPTAVLFLLLSLLAGFTTELILKRPAELEKQVSERTEELDKSLERNEAIINALPDMLYVVDAGNRFADYINPKGHRTYIAPEKFINQRVDEVLPAGLAAEIIANKEQILAGKDFLLHQYQLTKEGVVYDYEASYTRYGHDKVLVLVRDVTEKSKAERLLRESEVKYRTLVEKASDAILIADFKGRIIIVNPAACKLSQYTEAELLQHTIFDFTLPDDLDRQPLQFATIAEGRTTSTERKLRRKDGKVIDVEITASKVGDDRFLSFIRDISERKKIEKDLLTSREEFRQLSNYLENIREEERVNMAREIHDELGQQLTVLKMDLSRLGKGRIHDAGFDKEKEELLDLINTIVATVRKISSELRPSVLDDLGLVAAMEWYSRDFTKRTGIQSNFHSAVTDVSLPEKIKTGLFRIFQESLTNVARHAEAREVQIEFEKRDGAVFLSLRDDGKGFDKSDITSKKTLGLLGMKERAAMMKGEYIISSVPGQGTVTTVLVPLDGMAH